VVGATLGVTVAAATVEVRGLSASYGALPVLAGMDLLAGPGELVALIGPSGCGKSTVFNIIAGLDEATEGHVLIGGHSLPERLGATAYMPQRDALLPWRRVIDNVTLPLRLAGRSRAEARAVAAPLLERFGLGEFASSWPHQLSGGMRHRIAFLRTVIAEPGAVLLDEPFGALDGITRSDLQQWTSDVWEQLRATVLLVTHDIAEAVFLADRVYVLTPRPARVAAEVRIDLPRPRHLGQQETAPFAELERRLRHELRTAMGETADQAAGSGPGNRPVAARNRGR
jgi:ABC-type nitrate/sulfonate/bicarbonate transport system ATPase subunit